MYTNASSIIVPPYKSVKYLSLRILPDLLHEEQSADLSSIAQEQIALPSSGARGNPSNILRIHRLMGQDFAGRDQCAQALRGLKHSVILRGCSCVYLHQALCSTLGRIPMKSHIPLLFRCLPFGSVFRHPCLLVFLSLLSQTHSPWPLCRCACLHPDRLCPPSPDGSTIITIKRKLQNSHMQDPLTSRTANTTPATESIDVHAVQNLLPQLV